MHDAVQFGAVYKEHKNLVYNLALNYVQNAPDAQDITQEVFVKVYQNFHRYDPSLSSLQTWIYRITVNQCLDFIKARKSKKRFAFITSLFQGQNNEPVSALLSFDHPGVAAENKEELQHLFRLINELPHNQKAVLILTKIDGRSQKEVADIMNLSVKAVESLLQRARQALSEKISGSEGSP